MEPLSEILPILLMLGFSLVVACGALLLGRILGPRRYNKVKLEPYECGILPQKDARDRISVKYYLVAILFLLFDLEVAFLLPVALSWKSLQAVGPSILIMMGVFMGLFILGIWYEFKTKALEWQK